MNKREVYRMTVRGRIACKNNSRTRGFGVKFFECDQSGFDSIYSGYAEAMQFLKGIHNMYGLPCKYNNTEEDLLKMLQNNAVNGGYCGMQRGTIYGVRPLSKATLVFNTPDTTIEALVQVRRIQIII